MGTLARGEDAMTDVSINPPRFGGQPGEPVPEVDPEDLKATWEFHQSWGTGGDRCESGPVHMQAGSRHSGGRLPLKHDLDHEQDCAGADCSIPKQWPAQ